MSEQMPEMTGTEKQVAWMAARDDARYTDSDDPRAVLVAWAGADGQLDMGGWLDTDDVAFEEAVWDELCYAGEDGRPERDSIEIVDRSDDLLTTTEVADIIGVSDRRVRQYCKKGRLGRQVGQTWVIARGEAAAFKPLPTGRPPKVS